MKKIELTTKEEFTAMVEAILARASADHVRINFSDSMNLTTRFANSQIIQNVAARKPWMSVEVAFGKQVGSHSTNKFDAASLQAMVERAEAVAKVSPEDPEYLPPVTKQNYLSFKTYSLTTAATNPDKLAKDTKKVAERCEKEGCSAAGIVSTSQSHVGVASNGNLFALQERTRASFSLTATVPDSTGWAMNSHRKISKLGMNDRTTTAIEKAKLSAKPREIPPGHYQVILEPAAVAGLVGPMLWSLSAKDYYEGNSPLTGKLGERIFDNRLDIQSEPANDDLLGTGFDRQGLAYGGVNWLEGGVLKNLLYDRFTAKKHQVKPLPFPNAIKMSLNQPTATEVSQLIRETTKGILVTNFWYIRYVNPTDLTLTGMTRDGTFLIENGQIVGGIKNLRWHDSPLRVFKTIAGATGPHQAVTNERNKMLLPYLKLPDFNFTSVTRF